MLTRERLTVINPDDRDQVGRLYFLYASAPDDAGRSGPQFLAYALREFARIDEPTGLGAVVKDADGDHWVRWSPDDGTDRWPWKNATNGAHATWDRIDAVHVVSVGAEA